MDGDIFLAKDSQELHIMVIAFHKKGASMSFLDFAKNDAASSLSDLSRNTDKNL